MLLFLYIASSSNIVDLFCCLFTCCYFFIIKYQNNDAVMCVNFSYQMPELPFIFFVDFQYCCAELSILYFLWYFIQNMQQEGCITNMRFEFTVYLDPGECCFSAYIIWINTKKQKPSYISFKSCARYNHKT